MSPFQIAEEARRLSEQADAFAALQGQADRADDRTTIVAFRKPRHDESLAAEMGGDEAIHDLLEALTLLGLSDVLGDADVGLERRCAQRRCLRRQERCQASRTAREGEGPQ